MKGFDDIFIDDTREGTKIPKENYLDDGLYPIIDQGKELIAGYSNDAEGIYNDIPAILFGDHTRIVKYYDRPFFLGADGVKILKIKDTSKYFPKYYYYALSEARIPDTGYNRHFKWLKELYFKNPTIAEQRNIADIFDKIISLVQLHYLQIADLDMLVKSRFIEMFGNPIDNNNNWKQQRLKEVTTKIGSGATPRGGKESYPEKGISFIRSLNVHDGYFEFKDLAHLNDEQAKALNIVNIEKNDVLINITGASVARTCVVPMQVLPARVNQHVSIIRCLNDIVNPVFMNRQFLNSSFKRHLLDMGESGGATRQAITKQQLEETLVIVPPIELQNQFAVFVAQVDKSKLAVQQSLNELETLKKSLMQQYFG